MDPEPPCKRSDLLDLLREDDGDLVVRLTPDPAEWLILHRSELAKASRMLISSLGPDWCSPLTMAHPITGVPTEMYTLSLFWDGKAFVLSTKVSVIADVVLSDLTPLRRTRTSLCLPFRLPPVR